MDLVEVWTDGSCRNKTHDAGGYGIFIRMQGEEIGIWGGQFVDTTSAQMELMGAIVALERMAEFANDIDKMVIYCDNQYVVNCFHRGWIFNWAKHGNIGTRTNGTLLVRLLKAFKKFPGGVVKFKWVRGHNGLVENEYVDALANLGARHGEMHSMSCFNEKSSIFTAAQVY